MDLDIVDRQTRSRMMAAIRSKDTKPEMTVRRALHAMGLRFRLHRRDLPGRPDIVLTRWNAIILVNGCFFHGHACPSFRLPSSNSEFWREKIRRNRERDSVTSKSLISSGWRVMTVWECALRGPLKLAPETVLDALAAFVRNGGKTFDLAGQPSP